MSAVSLPSELVHANAVAQAAALLSQLQAAGTEWMVDASTLTEFDSSALSVLLQLQRDAQRLGARLTVQHAPAKLRDLAALYGVGEWLQTPAAT